MRRLLSTVVIGVAILTSVARAQPVITAQETRGTPDERAAQVLAQLTLEEKISLLSGGGFTTHPIERLGIPAFYMSDGPQGVRNGPGTPAPRACAFPSGAALAATWDAELAAAYGRAIGLEARARGTNFQLGPGVNICRLPVNGRNFEYFGEDPYLASIMAYQWVKNCAEQGVVPTIKHFAANNQEAARNSVDAQIDERTLHEIYLAPFKKAIIEGGNVAVMCSYNRLNGSYTSNHDWLNNHVLKTLWGFKGLLMSDWGASHSVTDVANGLDLEMPRGTNLNPQSIMAALADGAVKPSHIDSAVHRLLRTAFAAGWLDAGWVQKNAALPMDSDDSAKVALDVARASIVLLKNDRNILPLDRAKVKTIVVVGPNSTSGEGVVPLNIGGGGSGLVTPFAGRIPEADYLVGITRAAGGNVKVVHLPMPDDTGSELFNVLAHARTAPDGPPGLTLNVQVTGAGESVQIPPSVQTAVNATWQTGQLPFGVPAGRDATFTYAGVLVAPQDGAWEIGVEGSPSIMIDGRVIENANAEVIHLKKDQPTPIRIELRAQANPPARGRRGGGGGLGAAPGGRGAGPGGARGRGAGGGSVLRVGLQRPAIPDLSAVSTADAVIVCVGLNRLLEAEGRDRPFELPSLQQYLISNVTALNPNTVVINNSGAAVGMMEWHDKPAAILQAWYLGQAGGLAIGDVLFGNYNPSGRLCSTFDKHFEENPAYAYYPGATPEGQSYPVAAYTEGIFYGYRGYDKAGKDPLYPFGYGLSYTTFELSNLKVDRASGRVRVTVDVKNTGGRAGAQIVQVYVGEPDCPLPRPVRELKGFARVILDPGQVKSVPIVLPVDAFAYWSPAKKGWTVDTGNSFTIEAGTSERDIKLRETIRLD